MLSLIGIAPHPPIIIPSIGRGELKKAHKTVEGVKLLSSMFSEANPALLIIITPHGSVFREGPAVLTDRYLSGNFSQFGFPDLKIEFETDLGLVDLLREETESGPLKPVFLSSSGEYPVGSISLDHGAMVPLYYLNEAGLKVPGLHITFGLNPLKDLYSFGVALRRVVEARGLPAAVLASGDLSHRLIPGAPAGYTPRGAEYDQLLVKLLREGRIDEILNINSGLVEDAGECGLRSFVIALGMVEGEPFNTEIISYEGPFGVGYLVASIKPEAESGSIINEDQEKVLPDPAGEVNPAQLARHFLEQYFAGGNLKDYPDPLPPFFQQKAGAFVSLKKAGALRGCIGTVEPVRKNLVAEIAANAVSAAVRDPRFQPVSVEELSSIDLSVDVLSPMEPIGDLNELDPKKYGVLVRSDNRSGLLLPDLEGVDSAEEQVAIARRKAGIGPTETAKLFRFKVTRYKE
jgi:AmmeMemoRadiSam system protein A